MHIADCFLSLCEYANSNNILIGSVVFAAQLTVVSNTQTTLHATSAETDRIYALHAGDVGKTTQHRGLLVTINEAKANSSAHNDCRVGKVKA